MSSGAMSIQPLTTTFVPQPSCTSDVYRYGPNQLIGPSTSTCFPSGWNPTAVTYWSPGVCPSGYLTACTSVNSIDSLTETVATCCPQNFQCAAPAASSDTSEPIQCTSSINNPSFFTVTVMDISANTPLSTTSGFLGGNMNAYGVQIRFQGSTSTTPTTTGTSSSTPTNTSASSSSGLSSGAKAGIGVGVALGFIVLLAIALLALRLIKKRRENHADARSIDQDRDIPPMYGVSNYREAYEKTAPAAEVPAQSAPERTELLGDQPQVRHELEGDTSRIK